MSPLISNISDIAVTPSIDLKISHDSRVMQHEILVKLFAAEDVLHHIVFVITKDNGEYFTNDALND